MRSSSWRSGASVTTRCPRSTAVTRPRRSGFLVESNLRPLPPDRMYQFWALLGDPGAERATSAGVLGPDPGVTAFKAQGPVVGLAITDEQSPGSVAPSNRVLIQGVVS
jgi:hypothetical protein